MAIRVDPEENESHALFDLLDFHGQHVLEIGCGDGRLTWRFANHAAHVVAIDPFAESIRQAKKDLPRALRGRVEFHTIAFEDFAFKSAPALFDTAILSWSLC